MSQTLRTRHYARRLITAALTITVMAGTAGWTVAHEEQAITGPPPGTGRWLADHSLGGRELPDPRSTSPARIARFFDGLGPAQRQALVIRHPDVVGNLDGAPPALRYAANARALRSARDAERKADPDGAPAKRYDALLAPGRQILAFDPRGRGQVAEVFGDLATARRTAVVVPGSDIDLAGFDRTHDRYGTPAGMATSLRAQLARDAPGTRTAVVAWAGYTTPVGLGPDAATSRLAKAGAPRLDRFLAGLAVTTAATADAPPTVFCHSYGSVVCGVAAAAMDRTRVSDLVAFGSPGMGVDDADDLGTEARVWAARDDSDWIRRVTGYDFMGLGHGEDPTASAFGARVVSADHAHGHTGYFAPGTDSLRNFARIVLGDFGAVRCGHPARDQDCRHDLV
ncbi:alpha/beta hydrolase [Streptomyces sp. NBRC 110028]|uniref:alpha/beta hydrolase n=1 Tax=Streptomyces sp. NBRC 110028 TaxID=1621260 RepID=UPI0006E19570|nr:alpha/beta hydrolase [Streptomyces sp. NBRC 110028]